MKTTLLEFIYQFEVNKGTKEVFDNFFFKATKSENSILAHSNKYQKCDTTLLYGPC